jgi:hypothetical protein
VRIKNNFHCIGFEAIFEIHSRFFVGSSKLDLAGAVAISEANARKQKIKKFFANLQNPMYTARLR